MMTLEERDRLRLEREKKAGAKREITGMSKSEAEHNLKDMSFEAKFTMDEEGLRGLAKFLKEQEDETLDAIFRGKQGLILRDPKRGTAELSHVVRCKDCKWFNLNKWAKVDGVPIIVGHEICDFWGGGCKTKEDGYCSYGEEQEHE